MTNHPRLANVSRRTFLGCTAAMGLARSSAIAKDSTQEQPLVGIQLGPVSLLDEGIERCLDTLKNTAAINALFLYSQTYHIGWTPTNVLARDHSVPARDYSKSKLPHLWVRQNAKAFSSKPVRHESPDPDREYADRDVFREIRGPASDRGIKVYARILEADARRKNRIPGYENVLTIDHEGRPGHGPCWNNPSYREWVFATIRQLVSNYELDGLQYGAERTGPLSNVLFRGITPTCFCEHCVARNGARGIDVTRARLGYQTLFEQMHQLSEQSKAGGTMRSERADADGVLATVMRTFYRYPEVLNWDYQWFLADDEICSQVHEIAKSIRPTIDSGRHVDHQRTSWDFFFRSAISYEQMAEQADFIKPIVYHDAMGPRLRWWVLDRMKDRVLNDLSLEQSLQLFYGLFGHHSEKQPTLDELDTKGLGPEYVYREVLRCRQSVQHQARVYAGIGIDVPWYVPGGMEPRPSDPDILMQAVKRAFDAGADGVLASREYAEMRLSSLAAFGRAVRSIGR